MPLTVRSCALTSYAAAKATARALSGAACLVVVLYAFGAVDEACRAYLVKELSRRLGSTTKVEELESSLFPGEVTIASSSINQPEGFKDVSTDMVAARQISSTFSTKLLVKRRLVITSVRVRLLKVCVVRHKTGMLNIALLDEKQRAKFDPDDQDTDWEVVPQTIDEASDFLERAGEAPGLVYNATAQEDAEKLRDEGLRLWGKLRAVGARGIAKAVEATKSWEDQARSKPSALEDLALSALDAGRYAKGVVEDEVRKKRDWAAQQARAALLERLEKALPDVDEKPQWVAACLQGEVTFDRVELVLTGSGVPPGPALVVEMLVVDGSDLGSLPPRRAMRVLAKRLAEKALDALLDASPVDVIRLAAVVGAVTAAEAEKAATRAARDAASRARALADAAAREADERTRTQRSSRVLAAKACVDLAAHFKVGRDDARRPRERVISAWCQASAPSTRPRGPQPHEYDTKDSRNRTKKSHSGFATSRNCGRPFLILSQASRNCGNGAEMRIWKRM